MTAQEQVRKYFREVMERHKLPPLPAVITTVLRLVEDPDLDIRELCRVLSDDVALASRILAISRSMHYAQRNLPTNLRGAIQVLGLRTLRSVALASATQSLWACDTKVSEKLWQHSLAAALASRMLSRRAHCRDSEEAFLAGLMHDVGEMILLHGDPSGFEKIWRETRGGPAAVLEKEQEMYGFDHSLIGTTLLECWNLDSKIGGAVCKHHDFESEDEPTTLNTIIRVADYLCFRADLGFLSEPPAPAQEVLAEFGCDGEESLEQAVTELRTAFDEESALFQP